MTTRGTTSNPQPGTLHWTASAAAGSECAPTYAYQPCRGRCRTPCRTKTPSLLEQPANVPINIRPARTGAHRDSRRAMPATWRCNDHVGKLQHHMQLHSNGLQAAGAMGRYPLPSYQFGELLRLPGTSGGRMPFVPNMASDSGPAGAYSSSIMAW